MDHIKDKIVCGLDWPEMDSKKKKKRGKIINDNDDDDDDDVACSRRSVSREDA